MELFSKTQVCTTTTIIFIIFTQKPFFSIGIYATSRNLEITNGKVLAALTSFLLIIIAVHNSKTYIEELKSFSIVK